MRNNRADQVTTIQSTTNMDIMMRMQMCMQTNTCVCHLFMRRNLYVSTLDQSVND